MVSNLLFKLSVNMGAFIKGFQLNTFMYADQVFVSKQYVTIRGYATDCMEQKWDLIYSHSCSWEQTQKSECQTEAFVCI